MADGSNQGLGVGGVGGPDLPDDLLLRVFSYLDDGEALLDSVSLVCKRWLGLARRPAAWANVHVAWRECDDAGNAAAARVLARAANLRSLRLERRPDDALLAAVLVRRHQALDGLHSLSICPSTWTLPQAALRRLLDAAWASRRRLRFLHVELDAGARDARDSEGRSLLEVVAGATALRRLRLHWAAGLAYAGELRDGLPALRTLVLDNGANTDVQVPEALFVDLVQSAAGRLDSVQKLDWAFPLAGAELAALRRCVFLDTLMGNESCLPAAAASPRLEDLTLAFAAGGDAAETLAARFEAALAGVAALAAVRELSLFLVPGAEEVPDALLAACRDRVGALRASRPGLAADVFALRLHYDDDE